MNKDRIRAQRQSAILNELRSVEADAAAERLASVTREPDPHQVNVGLLRRLFEHKAAMRSANQTTARQQQIEQVFRDYFYLPIHLRPKVAKMLLAKCSKPFLARFFSHWT